MFETIKDSECAYPHTEGCFTVITQKMHKEETWNIYAHNFLFCNQLRAWSKTRSPTPFL